MLDFETTPLETTEGEAVEVCVVIQQGMLDRFTTFQVFTTDASAVGIP